MEMPKVGPEHAKLARLAGTWEGDETLSPSPWGPGGAARGRQVFRVDVDGFFVVQDYVEEKDGNVVFRGHGVFGWDAKVKAVRWMWFDSMGEYPAEGATGNWDGDTLALARKSERASARYTIRLEGENVMHFSIENSFDGEKTWVKFMHGRYDRVRA